MGGGWTRPPSYIHHCPPAPPPGLSLGLTPPSSAPPTHPPTPPQNPNTPVGVMHLKRWAHGPMRGLRERVQGKNKRPIDAAPISSSLPHSP